MVDKMVDEGNRCPFLLENDDSKIVTCMCNYYSLGQAELARALLHIVATKNLPRALRIAKTIIWHGPPKHWLCSVFVPSSAHLAWLCLIDFQDLVETHVHKPAELPPWLVKRLEFDVLIAQALLDGAAIQAQVLTAEVASELRAYHAGLLSATSGEIPLSFKLPALSLLQVTTQVSPYVNFLPAHTSDRQEQLEHFSGGGAGLSKNAVQQLYDLCKSQPLLGRCISLALAPAGCTAALKTARQIQQMCLGLTADALLQSLKNGDAWRYLKFLEVSDTVGVPPPLIELFSILLIVVVSNVRPTPALHTRLQALVSMSTSTVNTMGSSGRVDQGSTSNGDADGALPRSLLANAHAVASQTLSEVFAQAMPPEGSVGVKPWEHLRQLAGSSGAAAGSYAGPGSGGTSAPRSSALHFSRFLNRIRGDKDDSTQSGAKGALDALDEGLRSRGDLGSQNQRSAQSVPGSAQWKGGAAAEELAARLGKHRGDVADTWEAEGPVEAARIAFLYRTKIYEAFLTHDSSGTHTALRLFSILEDEFLRLKSVQSPLPPAFELLQPADAASYLFEVPPITFWDAYFEFTRVASAHCLEYVVQTAVNFIRAHDFGASAWLLAPFPQLKPLVILLCWPEFQGDVESRQSLLDTVWKSYTEETKCDPTTTGDLLVDYMVEVLNYRLSVSWWISKLIANQADRPGSGSGGAQVPNYRAGALDRTSDRPRSKDEKTVAAGGGSDSSQTALPQIAAGVLSQVTTHSILYVMRPNLPAVQSGMLLDALQSLPPLRQAAAALEHSYDLDLTRCYYTVRCAMFLVERCVHTPGSKAAHESLTPGRQVIQEGMEELDRLISSIERTPLKVSVFLLISSLCFTRHRHLDAARKAPGSSLLRGATPASGTSAAGGGAASDFLVPPSVLLSLLSLLKHHLQPLVAHCKSGSTALAEPPGSAESIKGADEQLLQIIVRLYQFTEETIWRIFISLKDFFMYSQLARSEGSIQLKPAQRMEHAALDWPDAVGAVIIGDLELVEFFDEMHMVEEVGSPNSAKMPTQALREVTAGDESSDAHPFLQLCTPMEVPLSLQPLTFIPRMLSSPLTLLHRSLKMNDYLLSRRLLQYFPDLQRIACNATVQIAERFKDLRQSLVGVGAGVDVEEVLSDEILEAQLGDAFERKLNELIAPIKSVGGADASVRAPHQAGEEVELLSSLSGPLLAFYVFMDLAVSAAPFVQMSTHLLKKAVDSLCNKEMTKVPNPALLPDSDSLLSFFQKRIERLRVLVEVRPEFKGRATLAAIILGIETLPSEPALLKSHLNRMHSQRHAIMSLVESVDLVKKGQTSASQRTLVDFLSSAIKSLTNEEEDSSRAVIDTDARDQRDDADQMAEGLGASRYLLRFLEYLTKVADLMHSASIDAQARKPNKKTPVQEFKREKREGTIDVVMDTGATEGAGDVPDEGVEVTKLFDVLAETPKGIVARLLFELGGRKQALALSEVMTVDLVEVIVNSSWVLPVWNQRPGRKGRHSLRDSGVNSPHYPASMEVVLYLAQHESPLPQVRNPEAPLLAMMACLERRGRHWPSWRMLNFAKEQSLNRFPALHRWVEERCHALRAIQWADKRNKSGKPNGTAILSTQASGSEGPGRHSQDQLADDGDDLEASEKSEDADADDDRLEFSSGEALAVRKKHGYTDVELQNLSVEDRLALEAIGGDHEAGMSAAYTKLVHAFIAESRNEEALQVCDEFLPFDSNLIDKVLHLYLKSSKKEREEHDPTLFHSALLDHECMYRVKRMTLAAQLTLERYKHWDITTAVQTVSMCLQRMDMDSSTEAGLEVHSLKLELKRILQKMITFEKILQVSRGRWRVWQEIEDMSKEQVSGAVDHLLALQQHDLARTLTQMYGMTDPLHSLELSRLHYLFTKKNDKTSAINHLLLLPPAQAVSFALQLLNMFDLIHHRVLLCRMLLTRLHSWLSEKEDQRLRVLHASLQLLGTVSETMQPHFLRLLRKPVLIVESLLMNARVDLLKPFLSDFPEYRHDKLILRYARKALALSPTPPGSLGIEVPLQEETAAASDGEESKEKFVAGSGLGGAWCLTGDSAEDRQLREEHVFKEAPSINLAEQILELCSDLPENASSCFEICNELSLRLHDLTPKYAVTSDGSSSAAVGVESGDQSGAQAPPSGAADAAVNGTGSEDAGGAEKPDAPLSVRLVTFMIRRLLTYLQQKFRGAGAEIQVQLDRSLNNLSFIPLLWQISGHKVGLSELCNPEKAAALRDELIKEDQLSLALELCERCSGEGKAREADGESGIPLYSEDADAAWHISADPVREAKAVALQKLHRYAEARQEFSQTEAAVPHAAKSTLNSFENAMRYPQLFDLNALGNMQSLYTFNSLQRKLYRSTSQLPALPSILLMGNTPVDSGSSPLDVSAGGQQTRRGLGAGLDVGGKMPIPKVPVVPLGHPVDSSSVLPGGAGDAGNDPGSKSTAAAANGKGRVQLQAMEECMRSAVRQRTRRRWQTAAADKMEAADSQDMRTDGTSSKSDHDQGWPELYPNSKPGTVFANAVTYLYPPIHSPELPSWSPLYETLKSTKAHTSKEGAPAGEAPPEEARPAINPPEDKERPSEETAVVNEAEMDGAKPRDEEGETSDTMPEVSYSRRMMDATRVCCGCGGSQNLRSQSSLWPEDNHTHSLLQASPMALPLAVPHVVIERGERLLHNVAFNELLYFQENYGTAESLLSMLVRERHLTQACYYIFTEKVSKRLFVDVVAHHCLAHNQIHELQKVILDFDPSLRRVQEYLSALKDFLRDRRALDLLYSYQVFTKDFVNAGLLAIQLFIASNTWDARVGHLQNALAHLSDAHKQFFGRKKGSQVSAGPRPDADSADAEREGTVSHGVSDSNVHGSTGEGGLPIDGISGLEVTEGEIRRNLEIVRLQISICEAMPTEIPHSVDLFGPISSQCEVAERLLVVGYFDLAQRVIDFLDLPIVELCVRASNQIATTEARSPTGSIAPVVRFLEAIPKLPPVEWDSLVSNVVNIWIIEKAELQADPSAANQLIKFVQDERCRMDALVLTGNLNNAFQIAQRLGNLQDVLHIRSCAQKSGDQELLKMIHSFLATSRGRDYFKANMSF